MGWCFGDLSYLVLLVEYFLVLGGYLLIGGGVLHGMEKDGEMDRIKLEQDILDQANLTDTQIALLSSNSICTFRTENDREWTFAGATFFSLTVVTTIGYGHITPLTAAGRAFTLVYSILGIGLVAHIMKKMARVVLKMMTRVWRRLAGKERDVAETGQLSQGLREKAFITFDRFDVDRSGTIDMDELGQFLEALSDSTVDPLVISHVMHQADTDPDGVLTKEEMVQAVTVFYNLQNELPKAIVWRNIGSGCLVMFFWLFTWAAAFSYQEDWGYREGFWYCYVTLTTIGFGDYHPRSNTGRVMAFLFIIPGLSVVGWFIHAVFAASQAKRYWFLQRAYAKGKLSERVLRAQGMRPLARLKDPGSESLQLIDNIQEYKATPLKNLSLTPSDYPVLAEPEVPESVISPPLTPNGTSISTSMSPRAGPREATPSYTAPRRSPRVRPHSAVHYQRGRGGSTPGPVPPQLQARHLNPHGIGLQVVPDHLDTSSTVSDGTPSYLRSPNSSNWTHAHTQPLYTPLARVGKKYSESIIT